MIAAETPRKRAKPGCCRGCDTPWSAQVEGQCRRCKACLECCGHKDVHNSCRQRNEAMAFTATEQRSLAAYDGYWRSVDAGRQRR